MYPLPPSESVLFVIYLVAITAEAMSGALAAGRRNMDVFGVAVIAFVTALGGGTIRDLILGRFPIGWTQKPEYVYIVISAGLLTILIAPLVGRLKRLFLVLDAMGLVAFSLIGCSVAMDMDYPTVVVIMSGMITGICGGILRDILCGQVPVVFQHELYASVALAVCIPIPQLGGMGYRHRPCYRHQLYRWSDLAPSGHLALLEPSDLFHSAGLGVNNCCSRTGFSSFRNRCLHSQNLQ